MDRSQFLVVPGTKVSLRKFAPGSTGDFAAREDAEKKLSRDIEKLGALQTKLYASNTWSFLVILQAMDAAGKDGIIKHVLSGVNPQGVTVASFKAPSTSELSHDFLWRHLCVLPRRGDIGIFNRSYYEEVLVVKVHKELLDHERLPRECQGHSFWQDRYDDINAIERYLTRNGTVIVKFFLHLSKDEQRKRFLQRIDEQEKNWKFSSLDLSERAYWDKYMRAYEEALTQTSTPWAPWHIIPADHKWFTRTAVADIIVRELGKLDLSYPVETKEHRRELVKARKTLEREP